MLYLLTPSSSSTKLKVRFFLVVLWCCLEITPNYGQEDTIRQLLVQYLTQENPLTKAQLATKIAKQYQSQKAYGKANEYWTEAIQIKNKAKKTKELPIIYHQMGKNAIQLVEYEKALKFYQQSYEISQKNHWDSLEMVSMVQLAKVATLQKHYSQAIIYNQEIVSKSERLGSAYLSQKAVAYNNIGVLHQEQSRNQEALQYFQKAISAHQLLYKKEEKKPLSQRNIWILTNLATTQAYLDKTENATKILSEALNIALQQKNTLTIGKIYNYLSATQHINYNNEEALINVKQAIKIGKSLKNNSLLSDSYKILAEIYATQDDFKGSQEAFKQHLNHKEKIEKDKQTEKEQLVRIQIEAQKKEATIKENIAQKQKLQFELRQARLEAEKKEKDLALQQEQFFLLKSKETLQTTQLEKQTLEQASIQQALLIAKKGLEQAKKEKEIRKLQKEKELQNIHEEKQAEELKVLEAEKKLQDKELEQNKRLQRHGMGILVLVLCIVGLLIIGVIQSHRSKKALANKNEELNQSNEELSLTLETVNSQKQEIETQKTEIEHSHNQIRDSINYARRIQEAVLPIHQIIEENLPEHFIFFKPRDVVSGDFYWFKQIKEYTVIAAADCTGHGVPGAFMSMLGVSFLNEIIRIDNVMNVNQILDSLREKIKTALKQTGKIGEQQDGMDIALIAYNTSTHELQFAGAHNSIYIINDKKINKERIAQHEGNRKYRLLETESPESLLEIKSDSQPIGIYLREKPFTRYTLQLLPNDRLYLFSDGFPDQINSKGKKLKIGAFKKLLLKHSDKSMTEQEQVLENTMQEWQAGTEQIDDILVIGLKVPNSNL